MLLKIIFFIGLNMQQISKNHQREAASSASATERKVSSKVERRATIHSAEEAVCCIRRTRHGSSPERLKRDGRTKVYFASRATIEQRNDRETPHVRAA
eukprot:2673074-Pleurochrysis_carterae.AAC.6